MLRGIRSPRPPPLGAGEQLAGVLPTPPCIELAGDIGAMMEQGMGVMKKTLEG